MSKFILVFVGLLLIILFPLSVFAQENLRSGETTILAQNETINKDYFATGERVVLSGTVNGDVYLAGGNILVDGIVNGDLFVAGGNIEIRGAVNEDLRVTGGNIEILGTVAGNITAMGGNIEIERDSQIGGSLTVAGGSIEVDSALGKGITAAAGNLKLTSEVNGDVLAAVERVELLPGGKVNGNLTYYSQDQASISPQATVSGQVIHNLPPQRETSEDAQKGFNLAWGIFNFLSALIVGIIAILLGPNIIRQKSETILVKPWHSIGIGLLAMILTPILILVLLTTIIGIPIAMAILIFFLLLLFFAKIFVSIVLGIKALELLKQKKLSLIATFLVGLVIYSLLTLIPVIGPLVSFISIIIGTGAYLITDYNFYRSLRSKKLI